jgi:hypothetical protein
MGLELTRLVVIGTDYTRSCKSNYHMIMTTMVSFVEPKKLQSFERVSVSLSRAWWCNIQSFGLALEKKNEDSAIS